MRDPRSSAWRIATVTVALLAPLGACFGGSNGTSPLRDDAGADGSVASDAPSSDAPVDSSPVEAQADAGTVDPFAGVWAGSQGGESFTLTNNAGCSVWVGRAAGMLCDFCSGTYVAAEAGSANATAQCAPAGGCSTSPPHTDVGAYTLSPDGGSLTYLYNFGTWTGFYTGPAAGGVCDAGPE
jgi:hypothetical protein